MIIADFITSHTDLDELWMVVSPQNPLKKKNSLAPDQTRLELVKLAIGDHPKIKASDVEFDLPVPSYTIDTLRHLDNKFPDCEFTLIMGGDNLRNFHKWKEYEAILKNYRIYVYKRPGYRLGKFKDHTSVTILDAPQLMISATFIRECLQSGKSVRYLVPQPVYKAIMSKNLYQPD